MKISESSFQPHHDHDGSPLNTNPDTLNDFNADRNAENMDDWLNEQQIIKLTQKNPSVTGDMVLDSKQVDTRLKSYRSQGPFPKAKT